MKYSFSQLCIRIGLALIVGFIIIASLYSPWLVGLIKSKTKTITILTWTDMIDPEVVARFEKEHNARVVLRYFENNEELFVKLSANNAEGFDIIVPSDYITQKLIDHKLLQRLDRSRLRFWDRLDKRLLNAYCDPENKYSIPYHWAVYGLGIRKDILSYRELNWSLLFKPTGYKVAMPNTPRESFLLAALAFEHTYPDLSLSQIQQMQRELIAQKRYVEAYVDADIRASYLLTSGTCGVAVVASPFMVKTMQEYPAVEFFVPSAGSFLVVDNLVITASSKNKDIVYDFINFLFEPEVLMHHMEKYPFFCSTPELSIYLARYPYAQSILAAHSFVYPLDYFTTNVDEKIINNLWLQVKNA